MRDDFALMPLPRFSYYHMEASHVTLVGDLLYCETQSLTGFFFFPESGPQVWVHQWQRIPQRRRPDLSRDLSHRLLF